MKPMKQASKARPSTVRLTMAQALVRFLAAQRTRPGDDPGSDPLPLFAGVFAIFGHGNVAGVGEALAAVGDALPTYRAHNEQAMAHAAIAFAKAHNRRRMMACTTSIGPGATNLVTAAAVAHVNRLPILLLPGDTFAGRLPDPVLQQVESFTDAAMTVNDCLRPVSRYFDRITRPEQLLNSLPAAITVLMDPASCGPVTICLPQDVQAEAYDYPTSFFAPQPHEPRRTTADAIELAGALQILRQAERPLIIAGGGVHYALACDALSQFAAHFSVPVAETQAGKGALPHEHPCNVGAIGVTGSTAANLLARHADVILAVGTRLSDFTSGSRALFGGDSQRLIGLNVHPLDASKHAAHPVVGDARLSIAHLHDQLGTWRPAPSWIARAREAKQHWERIVDDATAPTTTVLPTDAQVLGAVNRAAKRDDVVVGAAGGLPGELHKLWRAAAAGSYHVEYGYSCMGYEIAGGLGVRMARDRGEVFVLVGDGSYLMLNSEIATSVMLGKKLIIVVLDNRGFGCINRLQQACGSAPFNNLLRDARHGPHGAPTIDFVAHAKALGARAQKVATLAALENALEKARDSDRTEMICIDTDPAPAPYDGGAWWDVPVAAVSLTAGVQSARRHYEEALARRAERRAGAAPGGNEGQSSA